MAGLMERLSGGRILVADGAWGSAFIEQGLDTTRTTADMWNLFHPERVIRLAEQFAKSADILTTNTFGANRIRLAQFGLESRLREINMRGVEIARATADQAAPPRQLIAASTGPVRGPGASDLDDSLLFDVYHEQIACLAAAGADIILLETMTDLAESRVAVAAARAACPLEIVCSFAFREIEPGRYESWSGESVETALMTALESGANMVGANCIPPTTSLVALVETMRSSVGNRPLWLKPNAGQPTRIVQDKRSSVSQAPDTQWGRPGISGHEFALNYPHPLHTITLGSLLDALGSGVLGGCCGATALDIQHIRAAVNHRIGLEF